MRAWKIERQGEPQDVLACREVETPEPAPGEVRIRVEAAALGLPDVFMCRGTYAYKPELPATPGQEVSGIVTAVGEGSTFALGDRVMAVTSFFRGFGGLAEEALALDAATYSAPEEMNASDAACFIIPYHTAYLGLVTRGAARPGENLVVLGAAGGSGSAAVALGHALDLRVIAVAGGKQKGELCKALGADIVIDHHEVSIAEAVLDATGGLGANLVYDPVGGEAFDAALRCIASEGRLLSIGYASGTWNDASTQMLVNLNASVMGVFVAKYQKPYLAEVHERLLDLWRAGRLKRLVSREIDFEEIPSALETIATRSASGKIVMRSNRG